ncbi:hypothetical protein HDU79_011353 [Rhizoclosmatium sp. JEL0117]|nr:hypothetical protein HDU79_011353 [Rhizoclosmatium sp. JEL0117]
MRITVFNGSTCAAGTASFGVAVSIPVATSNKATCASVVGSGIACKSIGGTVSILSESRSCGAGEFELVQAIGGRVLTATVYTDSDCAAQLEVAAVALDKCIALSVPGASQAINAVFTNGNGTMTTTLYDDSACSVVSKNQSVSTPAKLAQCEAQPPAKYGVCTKVVPECVAAFSAKYSGVSVGSFKYMEVSQVNTPPTSKSSAMTVGISALGGLAAFLFF